jgi:hypothetical protein
MGKWTQPKAHQRAQPCQIRALHRAEHFAPITENNAQLLQVLISQIGKDFKMDAVFGKTLHVLGHTELIEPIRDLLHCGALSQAACDAAGKISD